MKQKETLSNTKENKSSELSGDKSSDKMNHGSADEKARSPIKDDAFKKRDDQKIAEIRDYFSKIMETLGLDLNDESLINTPDRVAKMFVKEIFYGLDPKNKPDVTVFENKFGYDRMLLQKNISVFSFCEHHFLPIVGKAHVAYFSGGKIAGLSKLNRVVDYFSRRPQVQERLTRQIALELKKTLQTEDVAVIIDARHMCVSVRGIQDTESQTITSQLFGKFLDKEVKSELLQYLQVTDNTPENPTCTE